MNILKKRVSVLLISFHSMRSLRQNSFALCFDLVWLEQHPGKRKRYKARQTHERKIGIFYIIGYEKDKTSFEPPRQPNRNCQHSINKKITQKSNEIYKSFYSCILTNTLLPL